MDLSCNKMDECVCSCIATSGSTSQCIAMECELHTNYTIIMLFCYFSQSFPLRFWFTLIWHNNQCEKKGVTAAAEAIISILTISKSIEYQHIERFVNQRKPSQAHLIMMVDGGDGESLE